MNRKTLLWILSVLILVAAGGVLMLRPQLERPRPVGAESGARETYRIGAILPLTGPIAWLGEHTRDGLALAAEHFETQAEDPDFDLEVLYGDSKGDPKEAVTLANRFLNVDGVNSLMVLGTAPVNAVLPVADRHDTLLFGFTLHPGIAKKSPNLFRIYVSDDQEWRMLAGHINQSPIHRIGVLHINAEYGLDSLKILRRHLVEDIEIVYAEPYPIGESNFRSILSRVRGSGVDAIVLMGYGSEYVPLLGQMREMGFDAQILGNVDFTFDFVRDVPEAEGAIFTAPAFSFGEYTEASRGFVEAYSSRYGGEPAWDVAYSYDALLILAEAIRRAGTFDTETVRGELLGISGYEGASGEISIDEHGDGLSAIHLATLRGGRVVPLEQP